MGLFGLFAEVGRAQRTVHIPSCGCISLSLSVSTEYPDRSSLSEEGLALAHVQGALAGKSRQLELEAAAQVTSTVSKVRARNAFRLLCPHSLLTGRRTQPGSGPTHRHTRGPRPRSLLNSVKLTIPAINIFSDFLFQLSSN